jgi:DNA repair exonuclease SbcCD ATPase subunit
MQRELNPDLFGEKRLAPETPAFVAERPMEPSFLDVDRQILELKAQNKNIYENNRRVQTQLADHIKSSHIKLERMQQLIGRLETSHNGLAQEIATRLTQMQQRIVERASYDEKTQEMIDRHNHVLKCG